MPDLSLVQWYCAETHPHKEFRAKFHLNEQGFDTLLPTEIRDHHLKKARAYPIFPGYIFVAFALGSHWRAIRSTPGIRNLLILEPPHPTAVSDETISELVELSERQSTADGLVLPPDAVIMVKTGRWRGLTGIHESTDEGVVGLRTSILGKDTVLKFLRHNIFYSTPKVKQNVA